MSRADLILWSLMAGGVLALMLLTIADAIVDRSVGALRNALIVGLLGSVCVLLCGLPEQIWPEIPERVLMVLKTGLGPVSGAIGLRFLGIWTGAARDDALLSAVTYSGCYVLLIASAIAAMLAIFVPADAYPVLMLASAALAGTSLGLTVTIAIRTRFLGDPLARWLLLSTLVLCAVASSLYLDALGMQLPVWIHALTAFGALLGLLIMMLLSITRLKARRENARLARLDEGNDPVTGLPTGSRLMSDIEHAFWRASRVRGHCLVVCVHLRNLYELGDRVGHAGNNQIQAITAARIRRAAGFRCVIGLYHPRCFVLVFTLDRKERVSDTVVSRIRESVTQPLPVQGPQDRHRQFQPVVGVAALTVWPENSQAVSVLNEAEHRAMDEVRRHHPPGPELGSSDDQLDTTW